MAQLHCRSRVARTVVQPSPYIARSKTPAIGAAVRAFLEERDLAPGSVRLYRLTLERLMAAAGEGAPVGSLTPALLKRFLREAYGVGT